MGNLLFIYCFGNGVQDCFKFRGIYFGDPAGSFESGSMAYIYGILIAFVIIGSIFFVISLISKIAGTKRLLIEKEQALDLIARQKEILELREKSITDSLIYAKRIQEARLPSEEYFRSNIASSFIFFRPKDIVSGDFYWIGEKNGRIYVVAADCTGHGVSGALMSMIGMEIIEKAIVEENIEIPSDILEALSKGLEKTFSREKNIGTIIRDGMDAGICIIDIKKRRLSYAGAFFPLYLIRDNGLIQINGDKIIIGMNTFNLPYTDHEIDIQENDMLYIFSDGYADQFGGEENKKFMYRRLRYLLLNIHEFDVKDQKSILDENIINWMGTNAQVDDMMIIGFRPLEKGAK
jgi:serine phosphatase RsbU (regulator of sigma subunit)